MNNGLLTHGVLKIADIANRKAVEPTAKATPADPKAQAQTKIATAKVYATREMKEFTERTEEYIKFLESTALFAEGGVLIRQLMIGQFLEQIVEPVLTNHRPMGLPQEAFNNLRRDMFKALIDKYVDNAGK